MNLPLPERDPAEPVTPGMYDRVVQLVNRVLWPELRDLRQRFNAGDFPDDEFDPSDYK